MLENIVAYFVKRHFVTNFLLIAVIAGGIFAWQNTSKEELPDVTFEIVRIMTSYPGAPAGDVEYYVTEPIEEALRGIDGIRLITSNTGVGRSDITVELEPDYKDIAEAFNEIRNEVLDVDLPSDIIDDPSIHIFKTSKKAILDIGIINTKKHLLTVEERQELQTYALALEDHLLTLAAVNSINKRGYLQEEIQIKAYPDKLIEYEIPFNVGRNEVKNNHIRQPAGTIETDQEPKVTLLSELTSVEELNELIVQGGFEGGVIRLREIADVHEGFEKNDNIMKVNGHEAIMFSVVKNSSYGILVALDEVTKAIDKFRENNLKGTSIQLVLLDDESVDIRNRLSIIGYNSIIGFILIIATLFVFLDIRSGLWVAMGIPFTFCFTMICASWMGYTINGTTLAAVIIVMGMIVDDAIVVAENINRSLAEGQRRKDAVIKGTVYVLLPIVASILTTCIAFIPLFFFTGRYGKFVQFIPPVIFLMLGASLLESLFILPGHMALRLPKLDALFIGTRGKDKKAERKHWFKNVEASYGRILERILPHKWIILLFFGLMLLASIVIMKYQLKFVMFPDEETREITIVGEAPAGTLRAETAELTLQIEKIALSSLKEELVGMRTGIARGRRGGVVEENKFRVVIEIVSKEKRKRSADQMIEDLREPIEALEGFKEIKFQKSRWGSSSGSSIELFVQQNDDKKRTVVLEEVKKIMETFPALENVEIDEGLQIPEYRIHINQERVKRLSIDPADIASTLRAALEGTIVYEFKRGDKDIQVRVTTVDEAKDDIERILDIPVENHGNYLVPLRDVVRVESRQAPSNIFRRELKRSTIIYADVKHNSGMTPVGVADHFESEVFPTIIARYPTTTFHFGGEVEDTRESKQNLINAIVMTILLIYCVLAILFKSLTKPLIIMLAIPFGVVGIVFAFWLHGKTLFGFYAAIGTLGLAGVVINDSIVMLVKLDNEFDRSQERFAIYPQVAAIAQTRLRAVILTTLTTIAGLLPTAYGFAGYDSMLAEMMLALTWGLFFGTAITLLLMPCVYSMEMEFLYKIPRRVKDGGDE
ncbi:MAG: efflux RND transporter permease subunit [Candidatus Omnitrophica bacterium]|nr:efflux RND transporter permease subunit [Candidatus Omnitrophota bacterium]